MQPSTDRGFLPFQTISQRVSTVTTRINALNLRSSRPFWNGIKDSSLKRYLQVLSEHFRRIAVVNIQFERAAHLLLELSSKRRKQQCNLYRSNLDIVNSEQVCWYLGCLNLDMPQLQTREGWSGILLEGRRWWAQDDSDRWTPLSRAAERGHLEMVKRQVREIGADVDSKDSSLMFSSGGQTPLSWAAGNGHLDVVKWLVREAGADVDSKDSDWGRTPLGWATANGYLEAVKWLPQPLSSAAENGHLEAVKRLAQEAGAEGQSKDNNGRTALDLAK